MAFQSEPISFSIYSSCSQGFCDLGKENGSRVAEGFKSFHLAPQRLVWAEQVLGNNYLGRASPGQTRAVFVCERGARRCGLGKRKRSFVQSFVFSKQPTQLQRLSEKHPQEIRLRSFSPLLSQACFKAMQNKPPFSHFFALKCPPSFKIPWGQLHRNHFALTAPSRCWLWLGAGAGAGFVPHAGTA